MGSNQIVLHGIRYAVIPRELAIAMDERTYIRDIAVAQAMKRDVFLRYLTYNARDNPAGVKDPRVIWLVMVDE